MRIGSLFSGIGGLELGLERAGLGPVIWQCEIDPFARQVLAKHWPNTRRFEDVRSVDENAPAVDLICGGFPCQDLSYAGNGAGLEGARSGLWFEYLRIVRALRPRFVVVENVPALLSRGLGVVLGGLAEGGYDAQWDCIPAQAVGAPHRRDRIFVVAWRVSDPIRHPLRFQPERGQGPAQAADGRNAELEHVGGALADADSRQRGRPPACGEHRRHDPQWGGTTSGTLADRNEGGREPKRLGDLLNGERSPRGDEAHGRDLPYWPPAPNDVRAWGRLPVEAQPAICRVAYGIPPGVDRARLRALGNAVVPQVAEVIGRAIVEAAA